MSPRRSRRFFSGYHKGRWPDQHSRLHQEHASATAGARCPWMPPSCTNSFPGPRAWRAPRGGVARGGACSGSSRTKMMIFRRKAKALAALSRTPPVNGVGDGSPLTVCILARRCSRERRARPPWRLSDPAGCQPPRSNLFQPAWTLTRWGRACIRGVKSVIIV